ncbi:hypothetical protein DFH01_10160 [Falsiroseomonas bella]|uniref:DUF3971 domain-containing protein n=1 Tax=Falsiroseomonas bella TaxID=2184016 RepID=A0A317FDQ4_9PROT|nr:AsmA-like C-terminal region-containing protein [Falsiroseomonas bella]PWS37214.1 hypothetical protein DFH01_10160 [Falsiroseomonas bella]
MARAIAYGVLALLAVLAIGLGALAWRLDRGPIAVPQLVPSIAAALDPAGPARIEVGTARLGWRGFAEGGLSPVEILVSDLRLLGEDGATRLEVPRARIGIAPGRLVFGDVAPRSIEIRDVVLHATRTEDGGFDLGLGAAPAAGPPVVNALGRLIQALAEPPEGSPLAALEDLVILDSQVLVTDRQLEQEFRVQDVFVIIRREPGGVMEAEASGALVLAEATMPLRASAELARAPARLRLAVSLPNIRPAAVARRVPALAPAGILDAPVALTATATLDRDGRLLDGSGTLQAGPGRFDLPDAGGIPFTALQARLQAAPEAVRLDEFVLALAPAPGAASAPTLRGSGQATLQGEQWQAEADIALDHAQLRALETWWPGGLAGAARGWVGGNLTAGAVRDGRWHIAATAPASLDSVELTALSGEAQVEEVAVRWHPDLPPLEGLSGRAEFTLDGITLAASEARQAGTALRLSQGTLKLSGLGPGPARAELRGQAAGPVADLWALLRTPGLGLLPERGLPIHDPTGTLRADIAATVPLAGPMVAREPLFEVAARLEALRLPELVLGHDLTDGAFDVQVDSQALEATGTALLGGVPARGTVTLDFGLAPGESTALRVEAEARITAARLAEFGLDPGDVVSGPVDLAIRYEQRGGDPARLTTHADLEAARIALPLLGYAKQPGIPATAAAALRLAGGELRGIESVQAEAPRLLLRGSAPEDASRLEITEGSIGATRFTGVVQRPPAANEPWNVALRGPVLDLRPLLRAVGDGDVPGGDAPAAEAGRPTLVLDARFERALTPAQEVPIRDFALAARLGGSALRDLWVRGSPGGAGAFAARLAPRDGGGRLLRAEAADTGRLLAAFGVLPSLHGGRLQLVATQPSLARGAPISGTVELTNFVLRDAPTLGKLLQALTGYGLLEALSGPGLNFVSLTMPFRLEPETLVIGESRAFSASLGLTAQGRVDRSSRTLDLRGTVVPAYVFNSLLGNLPIIGRLFSAERGGGLFAAAFTVQGPLADPRVSVNPLSALTPGFLRGIFNLGDEDAAGAPQEMPVR